MIAILSLPTHQVYGLNLASRLTTQLSIEFIMLIHGKMPTTVSMVNTSEGLKATIQYSNFMSS